MTRIALIGYGKMGKAIERLAPTVNATIVTRISPHDEGADHRTISEESLSDADVCIEFSHPDAVIGHIGQIAKLRKPLVIGTTGWYPEMEEVRQAILDAEIGAVYAENFSIGINLFMQVVRKAAVLIDAWPQYDIGCTEAHHRGKADSPSGTALAIAQELVDRIDRKSIVRTDPTAGPLEPEDLLIGSVRCGSIPGTHTVLLDSPQDTITLTHQARNRDGFALGALEAAKWITGRTGFYHINDMLEQ